MSDYAAFLADKQHYSDSAGFAPSDLPSELFDFQSALVEWACWKGRAAIFADCGLGKTPIQLAWADQVVRRSNRPVLVLAPLAASAQTVREAAKFHIEAERSRDGRRSSGARIVITNYEQLHHFDPADYIGVVCDESSILKSRRPAYSMRTASAYRSTSWTPGREASNHRWVHTSGAHAMRKDQERARYVFDRLRSEYNTVEFELVKGRAPIKIHNLLKPDDLDTEQNYHELKLVRTDGSTVLVTEESAILRTMPRDFYSVLIFADLPSGTLLQEVRARASAFAQEYN